MRCLVIFGASNMHPLAWLLSPKHRHVWCAVQDKDRGTWVSYNWHQGLPIINAESASDFDLAAHYRGQGHEVVEIERGTAPVMCPFILNNCVGHVKIVCAIKSLALTPHQLFRHLTGRKGFAMKFKQLFIVPGFGSSAPTPPPPPAPLPPPPTPADPAVIKSRADEQRRLKQQRGLAGTIKTGKTALSAADTANKTLLGN